MSKHVLVETQIQKSIRTHDKTPSSQPNIQLRHSEDIQKRTSYGETASHPLGRENKMHCWAIWE
jgi:hypothetical protein